MDQITKVEDTLQTHIEDDQENHEEQKVNSRIKIKGRSWKMRMIDTFGIKNYLIRNYVFRPPKLSYVFDIDKTTHYLKFYPLTQDKRCDIYSPFIRICSFVIYNRTMKNSQKCFCPVLYLSRPNLNPLKQFQINKTYSRKSLFQEQRVDISENASLFQRKVSCITFQSPCYSSSFDEQTIQQLQVSASKKNSKIRSSSQIQELQNILLPPKKGRNQPAGCTQQFPKSQQRLLVIYSHGNASDLGDVFYFGEQLIKEYDVDFLAFDYTGYGLGLNRFEISEQQTYQDLQNVLSFAVCQLNYQLNQIVLWGFSLGSGPTTEIASRYSGIGGVVLQAPLASLVLWLEKDRDQVSKQEQDMYTNINKIQSIKSKILIIHGDKDSIINIRHSQLLYEKYKSSSKDIYYSQNQVNSSQSNIWFIQVNNMDHNDLQDIIATADCDLGKKIFRYFREVDMDRACLQLSELNADWPGYEINRLTQKKETLMRETILLQLIFEDFNHTQTDPDPLVEVQVITPKQKQKEKEKKSQKKQYQAQGAKNTSRTVQPKIQDYQTVLGDRTKSQQINESLTQSSDSHRKAYRNFFCFCSNQDQ